MLESPRPVVLEDFNVHAEAPWVRAAQDYMATLTTMDLPQVISGPRHLVFCMDQEEGSLMGEFLHSLIPVVKNGVTVLYKHPRPAPSI